MSAVRTFAVGSVRGDWLLLWGGLGRWGHSNRRAGQSGALDLSGHCSLAEVVGVQGGKMALSWGLIGSCEDGA